MEGISLGKVVLSLDTEQLRALRESIEAAERLLFLLELDKDDMCRCVHGEILTEYLKVTENTIDEVKKLKDSLAALSGEQRDNES